jgi:transposase
MRRFKSIPIGLKPLFIEIDVQRVLCLACKVVRQVKLSFAKWRSTYTNAFERYALTLSKMYNVQLSQLRRALFNVASGPLEKQVLKRTRWLLMKNPENLNDDKKEQHRLDEALKLNQPLATAYYLKRDMSFFKLKILALHETKGLRKNNSSKNCVK